MECNFDHNCEHITWVVLNLNLERAVPFLTPAAAYRIPFTLFISTFQKILWINSTGHNKYRHSHNALSYSQFMMKNATTNSHFNYIALPNDCTFSPKWPLSVGRDAALQIFPD